MHKNLQNYRGWSNDKKELEISNLRLNAQIDDLKSKIKNELDLRINYYRKAIRTQISLF